jgi:hypothetical protein
MVLKDTVPLLIVALSATFVAGCQSELASSSSKKPSTPSNAKPPVQSSWSPPSGFTRYSSSIAWRWLEGSERNCTNYSSCIQVEVVTESGCPSLLYAKASIVDKQGRNLGYTNDTTSGVAPNQRAVLTMPDTTGGATQISAKLDDISCS